MLKFYDENTTPAFQRLLSTPIGFQHARNDVPLNFQIDLNGGSSTILTFHLLKIDATGKVYNSLKLSNGLIVYNSQFDILTQKTGYYPENINSGLYQFMIETDDMVYKSEPFIIFGKKTEAEAIHFISGDFWTFITGERINFIK